jgi:uncharacterized repeat protein (TIGR01451 family)
VFADVGDIVINNVLVGDGPYSGAGTWDTVGNQPCFNPGQGGQFRYFIDVFDDLDSSGNFSDGDLILQTIDPAPCNGDFTNPVSNDDNNVGGNWPANGQSPSPSTFSLDPGLHSVCATLLHVNNLGNDIVATDCVDSPIEVPPSPGTIIVEKIMEGGTDTFEFTGDVSGSISVNEGTFSSANLDAGAYEATEGPLGLGWSLTDISCSDENSTGDLDTKTATFNLEEGEVVTCTFTNTFVQPDESGTLIIEKIIVDDNGGDSDFEDFSFQVNGGSATAFETDGDNEVIVDVGNYSVTEVSDPNYTTTYSEDCLGTIADDETKTCTITNNDKITNSCIVPDTLGDNEPFTIGTAHGEEDTLAQILDASGFGSVDVINDQLNIQTWELVDSSADKVKFDVTLLGHQAGNTEAFGWYNAGDSGSFTGIFEAGDHPGFSLTVDPGSSIPVEILSLNLGSSIGFAIDTQPTDAQKWFTEFALNSGSQDNVAVYNPANNTYILAFEDLPSTNTGQYDNDHNDLVVLIDNIMCLENPPDPDPVFGTLTVQKTVVGTSTNQVFEIEVIGSNSFEETADISHTESEFFQLLVGSSFNVTETSVLGYATTYEGCQSGSIGAQGASCMITNTWTVADLELTKDVDDSTPDQDQQITYTINVTNHGPEVAENVEVEDALPGGLTFVSSDATKGSYDENTNIWIIGEMAVDETVTLDIVVTVDAESGTITNEALVDLDPNIDIFSDNNFDSVDVTVEGTEPEPEPEPQSENTDGGGGGGSSSSRRQNPPIVLGSSTTAPGQVLGAFTGLPNTGRADEASSKDVFVSLLFLGTAALVSFNVFSLKKAKQEVIN